VVKLFSLTFIVEDDSNRFKYVDYCFLLDKLKKTEKGVTHTRRPVSCTTHIFAWENRMT
jgi:hypothetical protein